MNHELVFTSVPRGLAAGKSGFCTVACTKGMASNMASLLQNLSGYRYIFPATSTQADLNPVVYSHLVTRVGGKHFSIISRISNTDLDYSNRSNKIAHHIAIDNPNAIAGGPFAILSKDGLFFDSWHDDPRHLEPRQFDGQDILARPCSTWKETAGHEGWAGELVDAFEKKQTAYLILEPQTPAKQMIDEALSLLGPNQRWQVSFSTYFTSVPPGIDCDWRCVMKGSPEAIAARRSPRNRIIDLSSCEGKIPDNPYVENAVKGTPIRKDECSMESSSLELTSFERELDSDHELEAEKEDVGSDEWGIGQTKHTHVPPELTRKVAQHSRPPIPSRLRRDSENFRDRSTGDFNAERQRQSKLALILILVIVFLVLSLPVVFVLGGKYFPKMASLPTRSKGTISKESDEIDNISNPVQAKKDNNSTNIVDSKTESAAVKVGDTANVMQPNAPGVGNTTDDVPKNHDMDGKESGGETKPDKHLNPIADVAKHPHLIDIDVDPFFKKLKTTVAGRPATLCQLIIDSNDVDNFINGLTLEILNPSDHGNFIFNARKQNNQFLIWKNNEVEYGKIILSGNGNKIDATFEFNSIRTEPVTDDLRNCVLHFSLFSGEKEFYIPLNNSWSLREDVQVIHDPLFSTDVSLKEELSSPTFTPWLNDFVTKRLETFNKESNEFSISVSNEDFSPHELVFDFEWLGENSELDDFFNRMHVKILSANSENEIVFTIEPYHSIIREYEQHQTPKINNWFKKRKEQNPQQIDADFKEVYGKTALVSLKDDGTIKRKTKSTDSKSFMQDCLKQLEVMAIEIKKSQDTLSEGETLPKELGDPQKATDRLRTILSDSKKAQKLQEGFNSLFNALAIPVASQLEVDGSKTHYNYVILFTGVPAGERILESDFNNFFRDNKDKFLENVILQSEKPHVRRKGNQMSAKPKPIE